MKKVIACLAMIAAFSGITAMAETTYDDIYYGTNNEVRVDASVNNIGGSKTVLVKNASTGEIVHIAESDDGFTSAAAFLLKEGIADGAYTATFSDTEGKVTTLNFYVGDLVVDGLTLDRANKMIVTNIAAEYDINGQPVVGESGKRVFMKGFTFDNVAISTYNAYKSIKLTTADGSAVIGSVAIESGWGGTTATGDGTVDMGIQIYNIPEEYKGINIYLSTDAATLVDGGSN